MLRPQVLTYSVHILRLRLATMSFDFSSLEPRIYEILSAPGTDLSTISAKRVRRRLIELDPTLTVEFFKENREDVDAVIARVFENVSGVQETEDNSRTDESYKQEGHASDFPEDGAEAAEEEDSPPPKKIRKVGKNGRGLSDAELARKLSSEINGRSTRTGGKSRGGSGAAGRKGPRAKKSATTVDSDEDGSDGIGKRKKSSSGGTAKGGFAKEFALR